MICALIMAGGEGTRFWPLSTAKKPKQFLNLIGEDTMIQMTVNRIRSIIPIERIFICTGKLYIDLVKTQLPELPIKNIIVEPEGRNTAPCIALSALVIKRYYNNANMIVLASDHLVNNEDEFINIIQASNNVLDQDKQALVTLGMSPSRAETGYGYIKFGKVKRKIGKYDVINVEHFVEKPNKEKAEEYINEGCYLWNGGIFLWSIDNILNQIKKYCVDIYESLHEIEYVEEKQLQNFIDENYSKCKEISIDCAILEKAENVYVIPSNIGWDDVGSWRAIERYKDKDSDNNIVNENVRIIESKSNMAINNVKKVVMIGINNIMAIETEESIFIVSKDYMDKLKDYKNIIY